MTREIRIQLLAESCQTCLPCLAAEVCKVRAIVRMDCDEPPYLDLERCYDCRLCVFACPFGALQILRPGLKSRDREPT